MKHESEMLEAERKKFEDLEFQQLEIEARMEEEREIIEQELLLEESEEEVKLRNRKVIVTDIDRRSLTFTPFFPGRVKNGGNQVCHLHQ